MSDRDEGFIAKLSEPERTFGAWLASKLDEDDWNKAEPMMLAALRSYGLACAMAERERCAEIIRYSCIDDIEQELRSRPVGDELMKEIEG